MSNSIRPVIIDLGKVKRKHSKKLSRGQGPLAAEVEEVIAMTEEELGEDLQGRAILPVVVLYEKKSKKKRLFSF